MGIFSSRPSGMNFVFDFFNRNHTIPGKRVHHGHSLIDALAHLFLRFWGQRVARPTEIACYRLRRRPEIFRIDWNAYCRGAGWLHLIDAPITIRLLIWKFNSHFRYFIFDFPEHVVMRLGRYGFGHIVAFMVLTANGRIRGIVFVFSQQPIGDAVYFGSR